MAADEVEEDHLEGDAFERSAVDLFVPMEEIVEDVEAVLLGIEGRGVGVFFLVFLMEIRGGGKLHFEEQDGAVVFDEPIEESGKVFAGGKDFGGEFKGEGEIVGFDGMVETEIERAGTDAEDFGGLIVGEGAVGIAEELIEERFSITQAAFGDVSNQLEGFFFDGRTEICSDLSEFGGDLVSGEPVEIVPLAAAGDGGEDFMGLGGGKEKLHSAGRLFEGFQEGVEGFLGKHVDFVDDVNFILAAGGGIGDGLIDLPDVVDAAVGSSIDFHNVQGSTLGDVEARWALIARFAIVFQGLAIEGFCKEAG